MAEKIKVDIEELTGVAKSLASISQHLDNISDDIKDVKRMIEVNDIGTNEVQEAYIGNIMKLFQNSVRVTQDVKKHSSQLYQILDKARQVESGNKTKVAQLTGTLNLE